VNGNGLLEPHSVILFKKTLSEKTVVRPKNEYNAPTCWQTVPMKFNRLAGCIYSYNFMTKFGIYKILINNLFVKSAGAKVNTQPAKQAVTHMSSNEPFSDTGAESIFTRGETK